MPGAQVWFRSMAWDADQAAGEGSLCFASRPHNRHVGAFT